MTNEKTMLLSRIYYIVFSVVIVIAGLCLIAGCITIYNSGDHPFSREIVAETFSGIAIPVYLCLAMTILSFILEAILPSGNKKPVMQKAYRTILNRLYQNRNLDNCDEGIKKEILSLQKNRKLHCIIRTVVMIASSIAFLIYALNGSNFHSSNINDSMIKAMWVLIPCLAASFGYAVFTTYNNSNKLQKEIELVKQIPVSETKTMEETSSYYNKKEQVLRVSLICIGAFCFIYGFVSGGTVDVLAKAINICTECIGLG